MKDINVRHDAGHDGRVVLQREPNGRALIDNELITGNKRKGAGEICESGSPELAQDLEQNRDGVGSIAGADAAGLISLQSRQPRACNA
jgi:hypothetical protein